MLRLESALYWVHLWGLLAEYGARAPVWAAAVLAGANAIFGYFALPEAVTDHIRRPFSWRCTNPLGALKHISQLPCLGQLMGMTFTYGIAFFVYPIIWAYFGKLQFDWGPGIIGLSLGAFGMDIAIVKGFFIRPILAQIGENNIVLLGLSVDFIAFFALGFVTSGWIALALTPLTALGSIAGPALQGIMSHTATDEQQGELQRALRTINAVASIASTISDDTCIFYFTKKNAPTHQPGAPFILSTILFFEAIAIYLSVMGC